MTSDVTTDELAKERILTLFRDTLSGIKHCHNCQTCAENAAAALRLERELLGRPSIIAIDDRGNPVYER